MSNQYGEFFEQLGGLDNHDVLTWKSIDQIEALFPDTVRELKAGENEEVGRRVLLQLFDQIDKSPDLKDKEKDSLCSFVENLIEANAHNVVE